MTTEIKPRAAARERFCSKTTDYFGRAVVNREHESPPDRRFVTLEVDPATPPFWGTASVQKDDQLIGCITTGGMGWRTGKMLAVGWINGSDISVGDTLQLQVLLDTCEAKVVANPVYDPENEKLVGYAHG